ncbi:hypothetical protein GCM10023171_34340 [Microbacterium panaciterrae]|uniref:Uncharacterized protein n=2 Tax=Microbacterium panaciterrae TaxID=985759 RepID=A0ABP8PRW8_9MICO
MADARGYLSIQFIHLGMILFALLIALGLAPLGVLLDFRWLVPSMEGLRDNAWAALIIAIALAAFLRLTNMSSHRPVSENSHALNELLRNRAAAIKRQYGQIVEMVAERHGIPVGMLIAILVYEDLNRPKWIRCIENLVVWVFPLTLTVGIAQVLSSRPLSDAESIEKMGPIVARLLATAVDVKEYRPEFYVFCEYNGSKTYAQNVQEIRNLLGGI